ncbi:MAG: carbamoyltransferase [bacterium]
MKILGINSVFHETAASLIEDGRIVASVEEERLTGIKHGKQASPYGSWILPYNAINYCLTEGGITLGELDHVAYSFKPWLRLKRNLPKMIGRSLKGDPVPLRNGLAYFYFNKRIPAFLVKEIPQKISIRKRLIIKGAPQWKFHFVEHHVAHAAASFLASPFDQAAILSLDGIGETTCTLMAAGRGRSIKKLKEIGYPHSLGFLYEQVTKFLGFQQNNDEFKVMGLAAYGKPRFYRKLRQLVEWTEGGYRIRIDFDRSYLMGVKELYDLLGSPRSWETPLTGRHADIAASLQEVLEKTVLHILEWLHKKTGIDNLCLAGGVSLNCLMNERILRESPFKNIFIQPAGHDAGTALGAALWVNHAVLARPGKTVMDHACWGPAIKGDVEKHLKGARIPYTRPEQIAKETARLISQGKIVGWVQGRTEWGPRSLGNRSILADPRDKTMRERINKLKGREGYRPLSPAILEEALPEYFEDPSASPFMLFARKVRPPRRISLISAVNIDGTARFQSVGSKQNPLFHELIQEFYRLTGVPAVINTSLNYREKPLVCTLEQALDCFYNTGLDYLAVNGCLISKPFMTGHS